jgi:hypothetical protein
VAQDFDAQPLPDHTETFLPSTAVVVSIEASIVDSLVDLDCGCATDRLRVGRVVATGESAKYLDGTLLVAGDLPHLGNGFGQVLVLTENDPHVEFIPVSQANHVEGNANVDAFLLAGTHPELSRYNLT